MARHQITISVVIYRDYVTPLEMIRSLIKWEGKELDYLIYVIDNSAISQTDQLQTERDSFKEAVCALGCVEYIDAGGNIGFGKANNIALRLADSEYHAFVNPDVLFIEPTFNKLKNFMDLRQDIGMCIPRMVDESGALLPVYRRELTVLDALNRTIFKGALKKRASEHTLQNEDYSKPFPVPFGQGSFLFGRTSLLKKLNGFDENFFMYVEDADLCRRVNQESSLWYCPDACVVHKWEKSSHTNINLLRKHIQSYAIYFKKWGFKFA